MRAETWLDASADAEIYRCLPGSAMKVTIGDVAGAPPSGAPQTLECYPGEALRHFPGGALRCVAAAPVDDCVERDAMRRNGTGAYFFSYPTQVCLPPGPVALAPPPLPPVLPPRLPSVIPGKTNDGLPPAAPGQELPPTAPGELPPTLPGERIQGYSRPTGEVQLTGMSLDGGVGTTH
jgi:hypothetical protein